MSAGLEGIAGVNPTLAEHIWLETPYPMTEELAERAAAAVVAWVTDRLASDEVREAARTAIARRMGGHAADAALTAVTEALRGPS